MLRVCLFYFILSMQNLGQIILEKRLSPLPGLYLVLGLCALHSVLTVGFSGAARLLLVLWYLG